MMGERAKKLQTEYEALPVQARAGFWFLVCTILQRSITVITTPIFTRLLTEEEYGEYGVFISWMGILSCFVTMYLFSGIYPQAIVKYSEKKGWLMKGKVPGVATYNLSVVRLREDKKCIEADIPLHQIQDLCPFPSAQKFAQKEKFPDSKIVERKVFFKQRGKSRYVKKFLLVKTNKEKTLDYPKFLLHFTDYSSSRKEKMKISLWASSDKTELEEKMQTLISKSIKSGWGSL